MGLTFPAFGFITEEKPLHHFFNAQLLDPGEAQVSIFSNAKLGITDELELGTNAVLDGVGFYNIALKHKMFVGESFQTSFNSHSFFTNSLGSANKDTAFFSMHGIITTQRLREKTLGNWGLMDLMIYLRSATNFDIQTAHVPTAILGMDYVFDPRFAVSALMLKPVFRTANLKSDDLDIKINSNLIKDPTQIPGIGMLSFLVSYPVFNLEFNGLLVGHTPLGYINMWWRFS